MDELFYEFYDKLCYPLISQSKCLNLIASENRLSPFAKSALGHESASRYAFDGTSPPAFPGGSDYLEIQKLGEAILADLGAADYVNMRPLSGLHAMTIVLLALSNPKDLVLSLSPASGGHYATRDLTLSLGRKHMYFSLKDKALCSNLDLTHIGDNIPALIYLDQCHGLFPLELEKICLQIRTIWPQVLIHADVSHGLGLVLGGVYTNPLSVGCNSYGGSTHKTFPGPQKGVLLSNCELIGEKISETQFYAVSNHHLNSSLGLTAALWEFKKFGGGDYAKSIANYSNIFGSFLADEGIIPYKLRSKYSGWHQLWFRERDLPNKSANICSKLLSDVGVRVNVLPDLPNLKPYGLRIGVQELVHAGFKREQFFELARIVSDVLNSKCNVNRLRARVGSLACSVKSPYEFRLENAQSTDKQKINNKYLGKPWTSFSSYDTQDILVQGNGIFVSDSNGNSWIDAKSGALNSVLGHSRKDVAEVAYKQILQLSSNDGVSSFNEPSLRLAEFIAKSTGEVLPHTLFCNSGSEAAEAALKIAFLVQKNSEHFSRKRVASFEGGYHGCTMGALAMTQLEFPKEGIDWIPKENFVSLPFPNSVEDYIELYIDKIAPTLAAIILEPVQGIGGVRKFPSSFMKKLSIYCKSKEILLIFDEVFSGFGRTGKMFACLHSDIYPDILIASKGLTAGYSPLSSISVSAEVWTSVCRDPIFDGIRHGHTMSGNPVSCAIGLAVQNAIINENLIENAALTGRHIVENINELLVFKNVKDIRGIGLMIGIEVDSDSFAQKIVSKCKDMGLLIRYQSRVIQITPPMTISIEDATDIANIILRAFEQESLESQSFDR